MKRSKMIKYIAEELRDVAVAVKGVEAFKPPKANYYQRKAADLLDMIEGFGMQPPAAIFLVDWERWDPDKKEWYPTKERIHSNKWEDEE